VALEDESEARVVRLRLVRSPERPAAVLSSVDES
jgi:hypothetical protein